MKIKLETKTIAAAAESARMSQEEFVARIRTLSVGRKVCAHFLKTEGRYSIFICT